MNFQNNAHKLCGKCCLLFGWQPYDFWAATPAELQSICDAAKPSDGVPPDTKIIAKLMEQFPDG